MRGGEEEGSDIKERIKVDNYLSIIRTPIQASQPASLVSPPASCHPLIIWPGERGERRDHRPSWLPCWLPVQQLVSQIEIILVAIKTGKV